MLTGTSISVDDVIVAQATAVGGAIRGVIRVSGNATLAVVARLLGDDDRLSPTSIAGSGRAFVHRAALQLGDHWPSVPATLLVWPARQSYTRQPTIEIHTIGSQPVLDAIAQAITTAGARAARPGEFTLRALLAGRLDLTQAEAVLGVIQARSEQQLTTALEQLAGGLATPLAHLRSELQDLLAMVEAGLDFADEDLELLSLGELQAQILAARIQVEALEQQLALRGIHAARPRVLLAGRPNAGKSSLFNALCGLRAAIVADVAGTTRDYLSQTVSLGSLEIELVDSAGLDACVSQSPIDALAQSFTLAVASEVDLILWCFDPTVEDSWASAMPSQWKSLAPVISVATKSDLLNEPLTSHLDDTIAVSSTTLAGLDKLREAIAAAVSTELVSPAVASTAARSQQSLETARTSLEEARIIAAEQIGADELIAAELRVALDALGEIAGTTYTDDILDRVFSKFCIGK